MKKTIITRLSAALWLLIILMAIPLKASAIEESQVIPLKAIKSTGEQSLNTGYTHKANTRIVLDCEVTKNNQRDWEALFGARLGDYKKNAFCFFSRHWNHTNSSTDGACYNRSGEETNGSNFVYGERIKLVAEGKTATWYRYSNLNTAFGSVTTGGTADDGKTPMFLFNLNTASTSGGNLADTSPSVMTLYGCKIYEGSTLMCDFIPAKYNNTVGLYDRVNKTFHGSRTDKPFTAIEKTSSDATFMNLDESQVTLLDAIKSTGEQAFNTCYTHKANTRMELDCNVTKNSQREWEALFGARLKNFNSNAFCFFSRHNKTGTAKNGPCFNRSGVETTGTDFVYDERIKLVTEGKTATWYRYSNLNTAAGSVTTTGTADDGKTPMFLFNLNTASTSGGNLADTSPSVMTLYGCKIYEGTTLKCDFVPAKYNDVVGLYDRVNKTFSGSLTNKPFEAVTSGTNIAIDATNFPDETFRNYLLSQEYGKDGVITSEEIKNITSIGVAVTANNQQPIQSLQGIEFFTALDSLNCDNNQLTELDLSSNTVLRDLHCNANQLTTLTLPESTTLKYLFCGGNKLTTLDLSKNPNLYILNFCSNQIKDAGMDALVASLPTREGFLKGFFEVIDATDKNEGNKMTTAQVEAAKQKGWNPSYLPKGSNQWQDYPGSDATPEGLAIDATNFPDEAFRNYLLSQEYGKDGVITSEEMKNITSIDVAVTANNQQPIQSLQGIEFFTALKYLICDGNQLTTLDLSKNTALEYLSCAKNRLTALTLPESTTLRTLRCEYNQLTTLDLSKNTNLNGIYLCSNQIKDASMDALVASLPTREGFIKGFIEVIDATDENEGNVMTTTQVEAAKQKGWEIFYWRSDDDDEWQEYAGSDATPEGTAIDATNFPDETFRNYLLSQDYGLDGVITPKEIETIRDMNVQKCDDDDDDDDEDDEKSRSLQKSRYQSKQKRILASDQQPIQSLQGIEFFTALEYLTCDGNQLTTLDLSKNTALESLSCDENRLTALKLPENTTLKTLYCGENQLTTLDLSKNTALEYLSCGENKLTTLDLSKNTALEFLSCVKNRLTALTLPESTTLQYLSCYNNQLTELDLSKNTALELLYCDNNQLTTLDLSKNTDLKEIILCSNQIKDAGMDALVTSLPTKQNNEKAELYVIDAADKNEGNVMTTTQVEAAKQKGWKVYYWRSDDDDDRQEYAGSTPIVTYPVWVGETQVTENNMNDVLGDGKVTYTPSNNTGTLKFKSNTTINGSHAAAKIYVDGIDLVINAPKGIVLENSTLGISMGGSNRKLTVNGDITIKAFSPAINNCHDLTVNGNLTIEAGAPTSCTSITVNGNVKVTGSTTGLNAPTIVLNGTKHEYNGSNPFISTTNGTVTITGDLTATANNRPTIVASGSCVVTLVSGTWTLDGGNCYAIELGADAQLVIPNTHAIVEPENAQMKTFTGRNPYTTIADADGNAATHVVIAPHHVHSMKETTGKGATCTEPGFETYWTCTSCNKMFSDEQGENEISAPREIPATGHIWGEWVVTREATTTQEGEETRTCLNDPSHKETRTIPMLTISGLAIDATNFPDENFRDYLLSQDYGLDGVITPQEIKDITEINVQVYNKVIKKDDDEGAGKSRSLQESRYQSKQKRILDSDQQLIQSLQGIEFFTALKYLTCDGNQLTTLDLSKNTALEFLSCANNQLTALTLPESTTLKTLDCGENQLTTLDLSKKTALVLLFCDGNQLTTLDVSKNTVLEALYCYDNQLTTLTLPESTTLQNLFCGENELTTLDVSKNTALESLSCDNNQLTTLDVSKNTALETLYCEINQLTTLDVSKNTALETLYCEYNQLTTLDLSKNTNLKNVSFFSNQIKDAGMDALVASLPTKQNNEKAELYVFDATNYQGKEGNVMTTTQVEAAKQKGWKVLYWRSNDDNEWQEYAGSTTHIQSLTSTEPGVTENWYDLRGRKLNGMPKKKGVYLLNGRKVTIK